MKQPFSNATEAMIFQDNNCLKCSKYESASFLVEDAGCKYAFYIDLGFVGGDLPKDLFNDFDFKNCKYHVKKQLKTS